MPKAERPVEPESPATIEAKHIYRWLRKLDKRLLILALIVVFGVGFFILHRPAVPDRSSSSAASRPAASAKPRPATKTLHNGGYTYAFTFYDDAKMVDLSDGTKAYVHGRDIVMGVKPSDAPDFNDCSEIGESWKQAFMVQIYGVERPVCTPDNKGFILYFPALDGHHIVTINFSKPQTTQAYPGLKALFSSVSVSK